MKVNTKKRFFSSLMNDAMVHCHHDVVQRAIDVLTSSLLEGGGSVGGEGKI